MGKPIHIMGTIDVVSVAVTIHYDNMDTWTDVHVSRSQNDAEQKAMEALQAYLTEEFDAGTIDPFDVRSGTLASLVKKAGDEIGTQWWTINYQHHEVTI